MVPEILIRKERLQKIVILVEVQRNRSKKKVAKLNYKHEERKNHSRNSEKVLK